MPATVFQIPAHAMMKMYGAQPLAAVRALIRTDSYEMIGTFPTELTGEAAAEEMFDLSNNPSRDDQRAAVWGPHRSLSVGDVVFDGAESWLCLPMGWTKV